MTTFLELLEWIKKGFTRMQTSTDNTVRVSFLSGFSGKSCPVSVCCPDCVWIFCLDSVCLDSVRILEKKLFVICLSGRTRTRQSCPDFHCP